MRWPVLPKRVHSSLKALCRLAAAVEPMRVNQIAADIEVAPAETAKVMQLLSWAGLVESRRGSQGGFWLARPAEQIHIGDVLQFFENRSTAAPTPDDPVLHSLQELSTPCRRKFFSITMAQLASKTPWMNSNQVSLNGAASHKAAP